MGGAGITLAKTITEINKQEMDKGLAEGIG
jgi:hypothetical protein